MELVGAGLDNDIDRASRITPSLGVGLRNRGEVFHRVDWHDYARDSGDTSLVDGRNVVPRIVVVRTVNLPVHLVGAGPVERTKAAHCIPAVSWRRRDDLREVAPVQGQILNRLVSDGK